MTVSKIEDVLRIERAKHNMTIEEMCDEIGMPRPTFYSIKNTGFKTLRAADLIALADLFGVSTDYLLGREKEASA